MLQLLTDLRNFGRVHLKGPLGHTKPQEGDRGGRKFAFLSFHIHQVLKESLQHCLEMVNVLTFGLRKGQDLI